MSSQQIVVEVLRQHGGITEEQARYRGVREVRKIIYVLRQQGWIIETDGVGDGHYVLEAEPGQPRRQIGLGL